MTAKPKTASKGLDIEAFRLKFDKSLIIPGKIKAALAALAAAGPETWEAEGDFVRRAGVSMGDFAKYRDQFSDFWFEAREMGKSPTRVWAGTKKLADVLRETIT